MTDTVFRLPVSASHVHAPCAVALLCRINVLISDCWSVQGNYRACNRMGIESSTSSFLKISFETAAHFLTKATLEGTADKLTSPAARIVMGRQVQLGTGCFGLIQDLNA